MCTAYNYCRKLGKYETFKNNENIHVLSSSDRKTTTRVLAKIKLKTLLLAKILCIFVVQGKGHPFAKSFCKFALASFFWLL